MFENSKSVAENFSKGAYVDTWSVYLDMVRFSLVHLQLYEAWLDPGRRSKNATQENDPSPESEEAVKSSDPSAKSESSIPKQHLATDISTSKESNAMESKAVLVDLTHKDWTTLWGQLQKAITKYHEDEGWYNIADWEPWHNTAIPLPIGEELFDQDRGLAEECLTLIQSIEAQRATVVEPSATSKGAPEGFTPFPDGLVAALGRFLGEDDIRKYPRLVHLDPRGTALHDAQQERKERLEGDGQPPPQRGLPIDIPPASGADTKVVSDKPTGSGPETGDSDDTLKLSGE